VLLIGDPVPVGEEQSPRAAFEPSYGPPKAAATVSPALPRNWTELELLIETRLGAFESRHHAECETQFERGVQEGMRRQEEEVARKIAAAAGPLAAIQTAVTTRLDEDHSQIYNQAASLAAALGEVWLGNIVAIHPGAFQAALTDALAPLKHLDNIKVHLNPDDHQFLTTELQAGRILGDGQATIHLVADPEIPKGGAVANSSGGTVDARLRTRIERALEIVSPNGDPLDGRDS